MTEKMPQDFSELFADTSVLINFTLKQGDGSATETLEEHPSDNYIGDTVEREYEKLKQRRMTILESIYDCDELSNWNPPQSVRMSDNDRQWCAELLAKLDSLTSRDQIERRLSQEERRFNRGYELLFQEPDALITEVLPGNRDVTLLGHLHFIEVENDRKVVCECASWSDNGGAGNLVTADYDDMLNQRDRIEEVVSRNRNADEISIYSSAEFLDADPEYS